jgi:flagellin
MALTVTNSNTLQLLSILNRTSTAQSSVLKQLTTGRRINRGADDPAGLIALESLNSELTATNAALDNNQRTDALLNVADGGIGEISSLLGDIQSLVSASANTAGLTGGELAANQAQIDSALASIDRIVGTTSFNGKRLLDGTLAIDTSGADSSEINSLRVYSRGQQSSDTTYDVEVTASAQHASATFAQAGSTATTSGTTQVVITGSLGTATIALASGLTQSAVVAAVNGAKAQTGVSATGDSTSITLNSTGYGSDEFVSVSVLSGGYFNGSGTTDDIKNSARQYGQDASVTINGQAAQVDGLDVSFNSNGVSLSFSLVEDFGNGGGDGSTSFTVKGTGGGTFQLGTDGSTRSTIGIDSLATHRLGGGDSGGFLNELISGGAASVLADPQKALKIVRKAVTDVAVARGRIGGFQKFQVQTSINTLNAAKAGLSDARSTLADTDFAAATAELNRQNVLLSTGISLLGIVNQQSNQILNLLR